MRVVCCLLLLLASHSVLAEGFISRLLNHPVPGGVAVIPLGASPTAPTARYHDKPVLVVREDNQWIAIVGISLKSKPGAQQLTTGDGRTLGFTVTPKHYREQHIKLKNSRQVNPLAEDMTRINRELAEQTRAYQTFSPNQPSNLMFDKPVNGPSPARLACVVSSMARSAIPTPASTSQWVPAPRSSPPPQAR